MSSSKIVTPSLQNRSLSQLSETGIRYQQFRVAVSYYFLKNFNGRSPATEHVPEVAKWVQHVSISACSGIAIARVSS